MEKETRGGWEGRIRDEMEVGLKLKKLTRRQEVLKGADVHEDRGARNGYRRG